ncbi:hypothetical protein [uncultured Paracoccus sp.]|uniref:FitA-like ribbon-helix-helix domain-containing protein n=1 Tax=uncultured Paracoccus sp. TaxID=189685 RepID=UPI002628AD4C|nr:hypothetical protein [uncultured Paracoccus sp.]
MRTFAAKKRETTGIGKAAVRSRSPYKLSVPLDLPQAGISASPHRGKLKQKLRWRLDRVDCNAIATYSISGDKRSRHMASITIRNLDDGIKRRLRVRAAEHGRSMEEEAREILREVVGDLRPPLNLARSLRARVAETGGIDLDIPARDAMREPPAFGQ